MTKEDVKMPEMDNPAQTIAIYLIDGFALMSFASVVEPLRAANLMAGRLLYDIRTIPANGEEATSSGGAVIPRSDGQGRPDLALVVAGGDPFALNEPALFEELQVLDRAGVTLGGVSGGVPRAARNRALPRLPRHNVGRIMRLNVVHSSWLRLQPWSGCSSTPG